MLLVLSFFIFRTFYSRSSPLLLTFTLLAYSMLILYDSLLWLFCNLEMLLLWIVLQVNWLQPESDLVFECDGLLNFLLEIDCIFFILSHDVALDLLINLYLEMELNINWYKLICTLPSQQKKNHFYFVGLPLTFIKHCPCGIISTSSCNLTRFVSTVALHVHLYWW